MRIQLRLFASLREAVKTSHEELHLPAEVKTTLHLREWLAKRGSPWAEAFSSHKALRVAVNQDLIEGDVELFDGQEVAFFPPVTGG